jgi:hypothetical protein
MELFDRQKDTVGQDERTLLYMLSSPPIGTVLTV